MTIRNRQNCRKVYENALIRTFRCVLKEITYNQKDCQKYLSFKHLPSVNDELSLRTIENIKTMLELCNVNIKNLHRNSYIDCNLQNLQFIKALASLKMSNYQLSRMQQYSCYIKYVLYNLVCTQNFILFVASLHGQIRIYLFRYVYIYNIIRAQILKRLNSSTRGNIFLSCFSKFRRIKYVDNRDTMDMQ